LSAVFKWRCKNTSYIIGKLDISINPKEWRQESKIEKLKKRTGYTDFAFVSLQIKPDTIEDHHHTIEDQCCSWATPLKNCLGAFFKLIIVL